MLPDDAARACRCGGVLGGRGWASGAWSVGVAALGAEAVEVEATPSSCTPSVDPQGESPRVREPSSCASRRHWASKSKREGAGGVVAAPSRVGVDVGGHALALQPGRASVSVPP